MRILKWSSIDNKAPICHNGAQPGKNCRVPASDSQRSARQKPRSAAQSQSDKRLTEGSWPRKVLAHNMLNTGNGAEDVLAR